MKKTVFTILICLITTVVFAQKFNIVNASIALKDQNYIEAKQYIDEAYENESTSNSPKMWNYRSKIYLTITKKQPELDSVAIFKATEAYIKCMQRDKKGRVIVRKWTAEEDVVVGLINCGYLLFNQGVEKYNAGDYKSSLRYYNTIFDIIPFDTEGQLERGNIKKETILYNSFFASNKLKDNNQSKVFLKQLIDLNFDEPKIYIHLSNIYLEEENTDKALEYLSLGREQFADNGDLLDHEINLYIKLEKSEMLIAKLTEALEMNPKNTDLLLANRGIIYDEMGEFMKAEKDYKASLDINPESFGTNYNLGALYFNAAVEKQYGSSAAKSLFNKALPFLEKAQSLNENDRNTLLSLKQLYYINGNDAKEQEMKNRLEALD